MGVGIERHSMLVGALIEVGQLLQGVADEGCETAALDGYVLGLAKSVLQSWDSGFAEAGVLPSAPAADLPERVELRLPEGFAFYSVYPEAYAEAARKLRLSGPARVIGIRSIGTALGVDCRGGPRRTRTDYRAAIRRSIRASGRTALPTGLTRMRITSSSTKGRAFPEAPSGRLPTRSEAGASRSSGSRSCRATPATSDRMPAKRTARAGLARSAFRGHSMRRFWPNGSVHSNNFPPGVLGSARSIWDGTKASAC